MQLKKNSARGLAFAALVVCFMFARESRADDPYVDWVDIDGTHGNDDALMWAQCAYGGQDGYCTYGDNVYYQLNRAPDVNYPIVTATPTTAPYGYPSVSVASGEVSWCSVRISCHIGGGLSEDLYDEEEGDTPCHVDCSDVGADLADEVWVAVGVSQYPP